MSKNNPRAKAIIILCRWRQAKQAAIDPFIERHCADLTEPRDRQLVKAIVFGVLRQLNYLDFILAKFSRHPIAKMKDITREALRCGIYQLLFMDRVPESAAINETIKALKTERQPKWLTGFVNGVLRNICRSREKITALNNNLPLAAQCNHPAWLLERWQQRFGRRQTVNICRCNNLPAALCLRVNRQKISRSEFMEMLPEQYGATAGMAPESIWLRQAGEIEKIPGYSKGLFTVQDETAQLITELLAPFTKGFYLDACAGLGGKTIALAQMLPTGSVVWAVEPQKTRQDLLRENLSRLDLSTAKINCFAGTLAEFTGTTTIKFQAILVDAPCSGLGVTGRHPDIRWNRQPDDLRRFQKIQSDLLENAVELLAPNGIIVYATCSTEPEENEEVIKIFLKNQPQFTISDAGEWLPDTMQHYVDKQGFLHTHPSETSRDGFFAARLSR